MDITISQAPKVSRPSLATRSSRVAIESEIGPEIASGEAPQDSAQIQSLPPTPLVAKLETGPVQRALPPMAIPVGTRTAHWRVESAGQFEVLDGANWRQIEPRAELNRLEGLGSRLAQSPALLGLNGEVLGLIGKEASVLSAALQTSGLNSQQASQLVKLREWSVFALTNQNYCSPSTPRPRRPR